MDISFWKMHGAGNDFILIDDRSLLFPMADRAWIRQVCKRRDGVGSEGLMLIQPATDAHVRMRFFNPDGGEAAMCGNGARCFARLVCDLKAAPSNMRIQTNAGMVDALVKDDSVRLGLPAPDQIKLNMQPVIPGIGRIAADFMRVGVPHVVIWMENVDALDVAALGPAIRNHPEFGAEGTNVNFVALAPDSSLYLRTYERGVEAETMACGTGISASAVAAVLGGKAESPVRVQCRHGDVLIVALQVGDGAVSNLSLEGPAVHVFQGMLRYSRQ